MSQSCSVHQPIRASAGAAVLKTLRFGWISAAIRWLEQRRQWQDLRELDDRLLADVGISPEEAFRKAGRPLQAASLVALELETGPIQRS
jgi:uncharacterized protein YjiS (DUF1127 family)